MPSPKGDPGRAIVLVSSAALFMTMLDSTAVNVALPTMGRELALDVGGLQWVVNAYVLSFAALLWAGGALGDRWGRRRSFLAGLGLFTVASALCGLSGSTAQIVAFRAAQGAGAALLMPGSLSVLTVSFPPSLRPRAIGAYTAIGWLGMILGPLAAGSALVGAGWRSVFFLNAPVAVLAAAGARRFIPESTAERAQRLDAPGLVLGTAGLLALTWGLIRAGEAGWGSSGTAAALVAGAAVLGAFVVRQWRCRCPLMPLDLFRSPTFAAGNAVAFALFFALFGVFFFLSFYLQSLRGYSALGAGVRFLPLTLGAVAAAPVAGRLSAARGARGPVALGLAMVGAGCAALSTVGSDTPYVSLLGILLVAGIGIGLAMAPMMAAVMTAAGPERAGIASSLNNVVRQTGAVLGVALLGTLLSAKLRAGLAAAVGMLHLDGAREAAVLASAGHGALRRSALAGLSADDVLLVRRAFASSFLSGFRLASLVASGAAFGAALVAARWIPGGAIRRRTAAGGAPTGERARAGRPSS